MKVMSERTVTIKSNHRYDQGHEVDLSKLEDELVNLPVTWNFQDDAPLGYVKGVESSEENDEITLTLEVNENDMRQLSKGYEGEVLNYSPQTSFKDGEAVDVQTIAVIPESQYTGENQDE